MTIATLVRARERIGVPERWTQKVGARDCNGKWVRSGGPDAVCWCLTGACYADGNYQAASDAMQLLRTLIGGSVANFNDTHTHAEVIALLDRAIAKLGDDHAG